MNIKRAKQEIKDAVQAYLMKDEYGEYQIPAIHQRPILLMGPPGIGKTQIMEQISRECEIGLVAYTITHHTRQSAIGLPFIQTKIYGGKEYSVTEYTMSEIIAAVYEKIEQSGMKEGILFIDEINCVSETLAPTMLQFLQCKMFGNQSVPEGWIIVAAGNPPEYNKSVREFDVVTLDRIKRIDVEADFDVWKEYAYQVGIHPAVLSYLELRKENFYRMENTVDGKMFVTARGWEDLSRLIQVYEKLGKEVDREVVHQYLQHWKTAKDFANYLELYRKYQKEYGLERILAGYYEKDTLERLKFKTRQGLHGPHADYLGEKRLKRLSGANENARGCNSAARAFLSPKGGPQRSSPIQALIVKGRCVNAEDLVQLRRSRRVLQEHPFFREDIVAGSKSGQRALMESRQNKLLLAGIGIDVTDGEYSGNTRFEASSVDNNLLAFEVQPPCFDGTELGLQTEENEKMVKRNASGNTVGAGHAHFCEATVFL